MLINKLRCFLRASKPCSGFFSRRLLSYLGVPTAANKTASDFFALSKSST